MPELSPADIRRRRAAKRFNEHVKLLAAFGNNSAVATFVGAFVLPNFKGDQAATGLGYMAVVLGYALLLHMIAQATLRLFRSED